MNSEVVKESDIMSDESVDYARLAAEAFAAASKAADPAESAAHRARGYEYVSLIQNQERKEKPKL